MKINMKVYVLINEQGELYSKPSTRGQAGGIKVWKRESTTQGIADNLNKGWMVARIMDVVVKPKENTNA